MEAFIGQIMPWPADYAPRGWAFCDGSVLPIAQNNALFAVLGHYYPGGDGVTTFALPDLRGRVIMGAQTAVQVGQSGGAAGATVKLAGNSDVTIALDNLPAHNHTATFTPGSGANVSIAIPADTTGASDNVPASGLVLGKPAMGVSVVKAYSANASNTTLKPFDVAVPAATGSVATANAGGGKALSVPISLETTVATLPPFLTMNYIICIEGIFPTRS
jgi:microcystin-dependent protein